MGTDDQPAGSDGVSVEVSSEVMTITIDRPARRGALTVDHQLRIVDALERAADHSSLRVVLIRSAGPDFCTGADTVAANREDQPKPRPGSLTRRVPLQGHRIIELLHQVQLPVVCEVRGWAAGIGCQIALASDFVVCAEDARFWFPFVARGFSPDSGSTWLVPRLVGVAKAKELLMLSRPFTGREAADWGMVYRAFPEADVSAAVSELVDELARSATVALGLTKRSINRGLDGGLTEAMEAESFGLEVTSRTSDFREGLRAFAERREPKFDGR